MARKKAKKLLETISSANFAVTLNNRIMKNKIAFFSLFLSLFIAHTSQANNLPDTTSRTMVYETFEPATITLTNGKTLLQREANIFLKNSSLLYKTGGTIMEANIEQIQFVKFHDRMYVRLDESLAYVIDSLGNDLLLCVTTIDMDTYKSQLLNEQQITNFEIRDFVNVNATAFSPEEKHNYPLSNAFYFRINGKFIHVHERNIKSLIPKSKKNQYKALLQAPYFSWADTKSLMLVLQMLNAVE